MDNLTASTSKPSVANLHSGQVVLAGYKRRALWIDSNRFVHFKVGENTFSNLKLFKSAYGVSNLKDLEFEVERLDQGMVTAEFYDNESEFFWAAYLYRGRFCVGTSADKLVLQAA